MERRNDGVLLSLSGQRALEKEDEVEAMGCVGLCCGTIKQKGKAQMPFVDEPIRWSRQGGAKDPNHSTSDNESAM